MLAHASAAMTLDIYADLFDDDLEAVATALDKARAREPRNSRGFDPLAPTDAPGLFAEVKSGYMVAARLLNRLCCNRFAP